MPSKERSLDIFQMLHESTKKRMEEKSRLLESLEIREYFREGSIRINKRTCKGIECKLCIEACPSSALYWGYGEVKIIEDLCIYCTACVLSCIVDKCIQVTRKRADGKNESFGTPGEVLELLKNISSEKKLGVTNRRFPSLERYLEDLIHSKSHRKTDYFAEWSAHKQSLSILNT